MHTFLLSRASHLLIVWIKTSSLLFCCYHSHELSSCHNIWLTPTKSKGLLETNSRLKKVTAVNTPSRFGSVEDTTSNIRVCCSHVNLTAPAVLISVIRPPKYPDVKYHRILYSIAAALLVDCGCLSPLLTPKKSQKKICLLLRFSTCLLLRFSTVCHPKIASIKDLRAHPKIALPKMKFVRGVYSGFSAINSGADMN